MGFLKFFRGVLIFLAVMTALALIGIIFKVQIAKGLGNYLIYEDTLTQVDAAFVLSGMPTERLPYGVKVYKEGQTPLLIATGEHIDPDLETLGIMLTDAALAQKALVEKYGVDSTDIIILEEGTSTFEESEVILGFAKAQGYKRIMIVSSKFHTRRIKNVFKKKFAAKGIETVIRGAQSEDYEINQWWISEQGLIFVNNEYLKLIYYFFKY